MGYPSGVVSFTNKNAGDVIQPSHVNDPQTEITAIETGLLNGLSHKLIANAGLQSSNSTCVNLNVTGGSTFAALSLTGALQVGGNCTVVGDLTASTVTLNTQPRVKVSKVSTQSVPNLTWTALTFDAEDFNIGGLHSTASNPSRINCLSTGLWAFGATVASTAQSQSAFVTFRKNGNTFIGTRTKFASGSSLTDLYHTATVDQITSSADYVECMVFQNSGAALEFGTVSSSRVDQPEFYAYKLY